MLCSPQSAGEPKPDLQACTTTSVQPRRKKTEEGTRRQNPFVQQTTSRKKHPVFTGPHTGPEYTANEKEPTQARAHISRTLAIRR